MLACIYIRCRRRRRRWSSHRRGTRFPKRVRDRRAAPRESRPPKQSAFPAISDTDDIRFQHAIQISGSAVHHDDRTAECACHQPGLIGIIPTFRASATAASAASINDDVLNYRWLFSYRCHSAVSDAVRYFESKWKTGPSMLHSYFQ